MNSAGTLTLQAPHPAFARSIAVAVEAAITSGTDGGIEQHLIGLVDALGRYSHEGDQIVIEGHPNDPRWLSRFVSGPSRYVSRPARMPSLGERLKSAFGPVRRPAGKALRAVRRGFGLSADETRAPLPFNDGFYDHLGVDVVHFPYPLHFQLTRTPSVLTMHDLQHRHLPQIFSASHLEWREAAYPIALEAARVIVTGSEWARRDIAGHYGIDPSKIVAIPHACALPLYGDVTPDLLSDVRGRLSLPPSFALYPALTYEHKNHVRLLEAVAFLRDREGLRVNLICPGGHRLFWPSVRRRWQELGLERQVSFPGFVPTADLKALYHLASFVVFPTLFEGAGLPALEALVAGLPLTCSDLPPIREYAGDAALYFDPLSVDEIACALRRMVRESDLREMLKAKAQAQALRFSAEQTARAYWAVYHQAARGSVERASTGDASRGAPMSAQRPPTEGLAS